MKAITTLRNLLAVSLLLITILSGCKKEPTPQPDYSDIFVWDDSPKLTSGASTIKADSITVNAKNDRSGKLIGPAHGH